MDSPKQQANLERFTEIVLADRALHDQLRAVPDEAEFVKLAVALALDRGCEVDAATFQAAIAKKRRAWLERWL